MVKKVIGILLLIVGGLIFVTQFATLLYNLPELASNFMAAIKGDAYGIGYVIGMLLVKMILLALGFFMIRGGANMVRSGRKQRATEES